MPGHFDIEKPEECTGSEPEVVALEEAPTVLVVPVTMAAVDAEAAELVETVTLSL